MKLFHSALTFALLLPPLAAQDPKPQPKPELPKALELGQPLEVALRLRDIDGNVHRAEDYDGRITVATFWSMRCPVMRGYEERMSKIVSDYSERGVKFVMINSNAGSGEIDKGEADKLGRFYAPIRRYLKKNELPYTVVVDHEGEAARLLGGRATPHTVVFDQKGRLIYRGAIDNDPRGSKGKKAEHFLKSTLDALIEGGDLEPRETRPVGCGIKFAKKPAPKGEAKGVSGKAKADHR